jgi:glyoxylase I family protein
MEYENCRAGQLSQSLKHFLLPDLSRPGCADLKNHSGAEKGVMNLAFHIALLSALQTTVSSLTNPTAFLAVKNDVPCPFSFRATKSICSHGMRIRSLSRVLRCADTGVSSIPAPELSRAELKYGRLQHAGVLVSDTASAVKFYTEVLGMSDVSHLRPALEYPGAFIACGADQIHLMQLPSLDPREGRPVHGGRDRHIAVTIASIDPLSQRLTENGIPYTMSKSGRRALFCRDLDSNAIEFVEDTTI